MIKIGVVGCGAMMLAAHVPALRSLADRYEVVALADPREDRRELVGDALRLKGSRRCASAEALLALGEAEAVLVATPPHLRAKVACAVAKAGAHVLCDKPLATSPADAAEALEAAQENRVCLAMIHNYLCFPEYVAARDVAESGEIGEIEVVTINALGVLDNPGSGTGVYNWRHDPSVAGGGVLMDMLHLTYVAEYLLGRRVEAVSAYIDSHRATSLVETVALCRFESEQSAALVNVGWGFGPGGVTLSGSMGRVEVRYEGGGTSPFSPLESFCVVTEGGSRDVPIGGEGQPIRDVLVDFAESVEAGRPPMADGRAGLRALEATVGAYASAARGETVRLPLDRQDPVYCHGVAGLSGVTLPSWSRVSRKRLFGYHTKEE